MNSIETTSSTTVASRVAGEDIQSGDFVAVLVERLEFVSFLWDCSGASVPVDEPVRMNFLPRDEGRPLKVLSVCLPFVYAKNSRGEVVCLDSRQQQLCRLDPECGQQVWKAMEATSKKKKRK